MPPDPEVITIERARDAYRLWQIECRLAGGLVPMPRIARLVCGAWEYYAAPIAEEPPRGRHG